MEASHGESMQNRIWRWAVDSVKLILCGDFWVPITG